MQNLMDKVSSKEEAKNLKEYIESSMKDLSSGLQESITNSYDRNHVIGMS